jgi:ATP-dependent RNA helicase DDX54/DBP10
MSYTPTSTNLAEDRGYGVHSGSYNTASQNSNFVEAARGVTMDLNNDDGAKSFAEPSRARGMRWDKKNKKYVAKANDEDGSKGAKMVRGRVDRKSQQASVAVVSMHGATNKIDRLPRTGETETASNAANKGLRKRFKHKLEKAPKEADRFRDDFYKRKKKVEAAKEKELAGSRMGREVSSGTWMM